MRAILISTSGNFCAGADIREMLDMSAEQARATGFVGCVSAPPGSASRLIVAVRGLAAGGGTNWWRCATSSPPPRASAIPRSRWAPCRAGGTQRLARVVGACRAGSAPPGAPWALDEALVAAWWCRAWFRMRLRPAAMSVARLVASYSSRSPADQAAVNGAQVGLDAGLPWSELFPRVSPA